MPAVLVHGVPETERVWDALRSHLHRTDVITLSLPGFGTSRPDGFGATMEEYTTWLGTELERVGEPVDLVGHDWGGGFTVRLVSTRPDLVRSWVTDAAGLADPSFVWHDFAKIWQTPSEGEAFWEQQLALSPEERAGVLAAAGVPEADALVMSSAVDATMGQSILDLYRSATVVQKVWGPDFAAIPKPGLVVVPSGDLFLDAECATRAAERAGASVQPLPGRGHWWMLEDPKAGAEMLEGFWAGL